MTTRQKTTSDKPYHHGNLRNALIRAGLEILGEQGVNALTLRAVARRAGVSHTAPYRHFADKEALIVAIAEEGFQQLAQHMEAAIAAFPGEPERHLSEVGLVYIQFAQENSPHFRVMFGEQIEKQEVDDANTFGLLLNTIKACQNAGTVIDGDPRQIALAAWSLVHGQAMLLIDDRIPQELFESATLEEIVRMCLQTLGDGLRKRE